MRGNRSGGRSPIRRDSAAPRSTRSSRRTSSRTRCSTARSSAWTARSGWRRSRDSLLAVPIVEHRAWARQQDPLPLSVAGADLAAVEVLDDVGRDQGRQHQDADRRAGAVAHLMGALLSAPEADDISFLQLLIAIGRAERGLAAQDDEPFLVAVMRVERRCRLLPARKG